MTTAFNLTATSKTSIFEIARKAITNAIVNDRVITLSYASSTTLVYPNDKQNNLIHHLKTMQLMEQINFLKGK
tara:strand:- start:130 stop:348 length:219 start_codon:yes stop_codon:yes gene_type:complete